MIIWACVGSRLYLVWGCMVVVLYCMRRVDCRACRVRVKRSPGGSAKHQLTKAYMLFLAHWAGSCLLAGDSTVVSQHLGQGLPVGRVCRAVGARAPATGTDRGDRRR